MRENKSEDVVIDIKGNELILYYRRLDIDTFPVFVTEKSVEGLKKLKALMDNFGYPEPYVTKEANTWIEQIIMEGKHLDKEPDQEPDTDNGYDTKWDE